MAERKLFNGLAAAIAGAVALSADLAHADSLVDTALAIGVIRDRSDEKMPNLKRMDEDLKKSGKAPHWVKDELKSEQAAIDAQSHKYVLQQAGVDFAIGQPTINHRFPTATYDDGAVVTLDFGFIDPATLSKVAGPEVSSVFYEVNLDPKVETFVPIGRSFDLAHGFSLSFTIQGFEPMIRAVPLDALGNPIYIHGAGCPVGALCNVAYGVVTNMSVPIPEPAVSQLMILGMVGIGFGWGRRRRMVRSRAAQMQRSISERLQN